MDSCVRAVLLMDAFPLFSRNAIAIMMNRRCLSPHKVCHQVLQFVPEAETRDAVRYGGGRDNFGSGGFGGYGGGWVW